MQAPRLKVAVAACAHVKVRCTGAATGAPTTSWAVLVAIALVLAVVPARSDADVAHSCRADRAQALQDPACPVTEDCVLAIGDVHGDAEQAERALQLVRAVDSSGAWIGGPCVFVQTGDIIDRGPNALRTLQRFEALRSAAAAGGGRVETLLGNHELMNLQGDLRYVSRQELRELGSAVAAAGGAAAALDSVPPRFRAAVKHVRDGEERVGAAEWARLLRREHWLGALLRQRPAAAVVGSGACATLFVHAGLLPELLQLVARHRAPSQPSGRGLLDELNSGVREALEACDGESECAGQRSHGAAFGEATGAVFGDYGVFWSREYAHTDERQLCSRVKAVLETVGARQVVAGHTVQRAVTSRCSGRLFLIDVGLSSSYYGGMGAWQCVDGKVKIL